jgi:serine/threonine-protein kinase
LLGGEARQCPTDGAATVLVKTLPKDTRLGAYRIDRMLGEGGMGFVYEATHEVLNRRSAIKMLRPELAAHKQIVTRFLNEAKAVNLIDHQNIVNVYDYGDDLDGNIYLVMELLAGESLDDLMRKRQPMAMPLLLHVFGQIAKALAAAHAKQIVHRDLKPANVYVIAREDNPYFIKLLDFGIAQLRGHGAAPGLTLAGSVMGTPQYMSPEQISGGTIDARTDVWALGVMMYRAATGYAPFQGEQFAELADKILHHPPQPAGELVAVPPALSMLIASCLQRRIEDRCRSVGELIAGLERVKRERKLDDDAILAAVTADPGASRESLPAQLRDPTRDSIAGSLPRYQGAGERELRPSAGPPPRRARLGPYLALGAVGVCAAAGLAVLGRDRAVRPDRATTGSSQDVRPGAVEPPTPPTIAELVTAGDPAAWHHRVDTDLRSAIQSDRLQRQGFVVDALALTHVRAALPLLYVALQGAQSIIAQRLRSVVAIPLYAMPRATDAESVQHVQRGIRPDREPHDVVHRRPACPQTLCRVVGDRLDPMHHPRVGVRRDVGVP